MIPCRGESTEGKPEKSRRSAIVHHSSWMESKVVGMSRVKWVEVLKPSLPEVIEVMHLQSRMDARFYKGTCLYLVSRARGDATSAAGCATPSREDT